MMARATLEPGHSMVVGGPLRDRAIGYLRHSWNEMRGEDSLVSESQPPYSGTFKCGHSFYVNLVRSSTADVGGTGVRRKGGERTDPNTKRNKYSGLFIAIFMLTWDAEFKPRCDTSSYHALQGTLSKRTLMRDDHVTL